MSDRGPDPRPAWVDPFAGLADPGDLAEPDEAPEARPRVRGHERQFAVALGVIVVAGAVVIAVRCRRSLR